MGTTSFTESSLFKYTTLLVGIALTIAVMIIAESLLVPFAWAVMIALASVKFLDKIEHRLKLSRIGVTLSFVFLVLVFIISVLYFFYFEIRQIVTSMPEIQDKIQELADRFTSFLSSLGLAVSGALEGKDIRNFIVKNSSVFTNMIAGFGRTIGQIFLIAIYLFFLVLYRDNYIQFMTLRDKTKDKILINRKRFNAILDIVTSFLYGLLIITVVMATMLFVVFLLAGLKYALFFAVFVGLLSLIPYLGIPIGMVVVFLFALVTNDGWMVPLLSIGGIFLCNILQENVFRPLIIGDKIKLNAFMVFFSVIIGSMIWGIAGMILFMPLVGILKLLLESNERTRPVSVLFTHLPKNIKFEFNKIISKEDPVHEE